MDTLARQLNDYEEAVEWITNLRATGEVGFYLSMAELYPKLLLGGQGIW